jgi:hypothetical protein
VAGTFSLLYSQSFAATSSVTVAHGLDRLQVGLVVRVGEVARNDLIESITPTQADPRNSVEVVLSSAQTGDVLVLDTDYVFANIPTPESASTLGSGTPILEETADAAGDLLVASAADAFARLPVGADADVLTADSAEPTGVRWAAAGGGGVFGSEYQSTTDRTFRSSTSTVFFEVHKLTTSSLTAGTYRVEWAYVWSYDDTQNNFESRVQVDDSTELYGQTSGGAGAYDAHQQEPKDKAGSGDGGTDQRHVVSFFADVSLSAGVHEVDVDIATSSSGKRASVHLTTVAVYRIS